MIWLLVFAGFFTLCWLYLYREPQIRDRLEWYLRAGVAALMAGTATFVAYGVFS